ncbi:MAG: hypothetical protein P0Y59_20430 [Candidatus Sphingomonas phytovorans]|nr:hypothetical protein [Sphingomonas sp.]WEJ99273.1 MAG: hypothetical protein P0Y59_20430 [Sphingomonas sp.]
MTVNDMIFVVQQDCHVSVSATQAQLGLIANILNAGAPRRAQVTIRDAAHLASGDMDNLAKLGRGRITFEL